MLLLMLMLLRLLSLGCFDYLTFFYSKRSDCDLQLIEGRALAVFVVRAELTLSNCRVQISMLERSALLVGAVEKVSSWRVIMYGISAYVYSVRFHNVIKVKNNELYGSKT
jgi:hypothetical protein